MGACRPPARRVPLRGRPAPTAVAWPTFPPSLVSRPAARPASKSTFAQGPASEWWGRLEVGEEPAVRPPVDWCSWRAMVGQSRRGIEALPG